MKRILILTSVIILLAAACNNQAPVSPVQNQQPDKAADSQVYENQFIKVTIPAGWTAKAAVKTTSTGNCMNKTNCTDTTKTEPNPSAVNITKGNYILYINTQASQASGIIGGRFGEIAMGAPSADAVVIEQPNPPCGTSEQHPAFDAYSRADLYVNNHATQYYCHAPSNGSTVWYFSYLTDKRQGYFNYYPDQVNSNTSLVVTMAYNSKDVNKLPVKGSATLNSTLNDMTDILKSLEIKQQ